MFTKSFDQSTLHKMAQYYGHNKVAFAKACLLALFLLVVTSAATSAAAYVTNTTELIAAIEKANQATGISSIKMKPGTYVTSAAYNGTDNAFPKITGKLSIVGLMNGATITRQGTTQSFRFFEVSPGGQLWVDRLTFTLGQGNVFGGAILNRGSLTVTSSYIIRNAAVNPTGPSEGGAIYNDGGKLVIRNSTIRLNRASWGGGVASEGTPATATALIKIAQVTIETSALVENTAQDTGFGALGGGLFIRGANETYLQNTTFTANFAQVHGGGIAFQLVPKVTAVLLRNLTVLDNKATLEGGGIYYDCGSLPYYAYAFLQLHNSIVTSNGPAAINRDFAGNGVIQSLGHNIYGLGSAFFSSYPDYYEPTLASLTWHNDPKPGDQYWLPNPLCIALNNGDPTNAGTSDQLGTVRGTSNDIGAIERP